MQWAAESLAVKAVPGNCILRNDISLKFYIIGQVPILLEHVAHELQLAGLSPERTKRSSAVRKRTNTSLERLATSQFHGVL